MVDQPIELAPSDTQPEIPTAFITAPENEQPIYLPQDDRAVVELTTEQLEDILEASLNDFVEEKPKWHIRSKREASWAMRRIRLASNEKRINDEIVAECIRELNDSIAEEINEQREWQHKENEKHARSIAFFEHHLTAYHRELFAQDPKFYKSYSLPDGVLNHRVGSYSTTIEDLKKLADWVNLNCTKPEIDAMLEAKYVPIKTAIAKYANETGEIPPGVKYERSEDTFSVKPKTE